MANFYLGAAILVCLAVAVVGLFIASIGVLKTLLAFGGTFIFCALLWFALNLIHS